MTEVGTKIKLVEIMKSHSDKSAEELNMLLSFACGRKPPLPDYDSVDPSKPNDLLHAQEIAFDSWRECDDMRQLLLDHHICDAVATLPYERKRDIHLFASRYLKALSIPARERAIHTIIKQFVNRCDD